MLLRVGKIKARNNFVTKIIFWAVVLWGKVALKRVVAVGEYRNSGYSGTV